MNPTMKVYSPAAAVAADSNGELVEFNQHAASMAAEVEQLRMLVSTYQLGSANRGGEHD